MQQLHSLPVDVRDPISLAQPTPSPPAAGWSRTVVLLSTPDVIGC
jgi:hypothetical protein